jgi:hypothetical protein
VRTFAESAVDWAALGKVVAASLVAGIGVTLCFSLAVVGATRFTELRRDQRGVGAAFYGVLALAGLAATVASVVIAITVMTKKS